MLSQSSSPQQETDPPEQAPLSDANCPSCGRFVGPYTSCPYCGAPMAGRLSIKLTKVMALCFSIVGILVLWWRAVQTNIPSISIADIERLMNMAYVRIGGRITRNITYDPTSQYLGFWVDDGTGEIHVSSYRDTTAALLEMENVPALGDEVSIAGSLRLRPDFAALTLDIPEHLTLIRSHPAPLQSSDITPLDEYRRVVLQGEITSVSTPYTGLTLLILQDTAGKRTRAIDDTVQALTGRLPELDVGQHIMITGTVTLYNGTPQVTLQDCEQLTLLPNPPDPEPAVRHISHITLTDLESQVLVQGRVVAMEGINGGLKAILDDSTAQIALILWPSVYDELERPTDLDLGAVIKVLGKVSVYEDELEIIPRSFSDIFIEMPAPEVPWISIEEITPADAGRLLRVRGLFGSPSGFSAGVKIPLKDGSGRITVLIWSNIYQELKPRPGENMLTEVTGIIEVYDNVLEIIPRSIYDVVNMDQGD
jgi:DNA/RNA endonuclease YhcR with UshA esterase domain